MMLPVEADAAEQTPGTTCKKHGQVGKREDDLVEDEDLTKPL
jgi:hypothetical protein